MKKGIFNKKKDIFEEISKHNVYYFVIVFVPNNLCVRSLDVHLTHQGFPRFNGNIVNVPENN